MLTMCDGFSFSSAREQSAGMVDLPRSTFLNLKYLTYYFIPLSNRPSRSLELNLLARLMSEESLMINDQ